MAGGRRHNTFHASSLVVCSIRGSTRLFDTPFLPQSMKEIEREDTLSSHLPQTSELPKLHNRRCPLTKLINSAAKRAMLGHLVPAPNMDLQFRARKQGESLTRPF